MQNKVENEAYTFPLFSTRKYGFYFEGRGQKRYYSPAVWRDAVREAHRRESERPERTEGDG